MVRLLPALLAFWWMSGVAAPPVPIELKGDRLELNMDSGIQIFSGNVNMTQGNLVIDANQIKAEFNRGAIVRLSGNGTPLVLKNQSNDYQPMRAQANFIDYETRKWTLILTGDVMLTRPGWEARSDDAHYDLRRRIVILSSKNKGRVRIVFVAPRTDAGIKQ